MKTALFLHKPYFGDSLALISGAILTLAFAPFGIYPLAIISPAILLATFFKVSPKKAFWRGWLFGMGFFTTGVYWVYISIHTFGNVPAIFAGLITAGLIAILAIFPGMNGWLLNRYFQKDNVVKILLAYPIIWVFLEWVRSWFATGFPWLLLGTSQTNSPLKGLAPVFGVYGVSLALLICSSLLVYAFLSIKKRKFLQLFLSLLGIACVWIAGGILNTIVWTKPEGNPIQVSLIQGNIAQELKWNPDQVQPTLDTYMRLTRQHLDSKIIIWPEAAIPIPFLNTMEFLFTLDREAKRNHTTVITGIPMQIPNTHDYLNTVIVLGEGTGIYAKHRLVPFGEYVPFKQYFGRLLEFMDIPMSDFVAGKDMPEPIQTNGTKIATFVCYEIAYPELVLSRDGDINLLLTVSNDAWFDRSIAQAQHLQIAQMRAIEQQRPLLFVSNNGITATISPDGKVQKAAPPYQEDVIIDKVQPMQGKTPWQKHSMDLVLGLMLIMLYFSIKYRRR